ncbi:SRPBCC family protein [Vallitalea okinawensis]|uniref:SRPBCC family protein n=1 Tax=Vallitalea okinawensis TaxID=2078660 RepID=UPI000CFB68BB|nr:SRPBCC family protein [Vallitalea okinawensis]
MKKIVGSIVINKPIDVVTRLFLDPSNLKEYQDGFVKKELKSGLDGEDGCVSTLYYKYGNQDMIMTETVVSNKLPDSYEAFYHHQHMDNTMKCNFTAIDDQSTKYDYEYEYTRINWIIPKLISIFFPSMYRKQGQKWIDQFKEFVEASE